MFTIKGITAIAIVKILTKPLGVVEFPSTGKDLSMQFASDDFSSHVGKSDLSITHKTG